MSKYWMLIWFIIGVTVGLLIPTNPAYGRGHMCKPRADIIEQLSKVFDEQPSYIALSSDGRVLEALTSPTGTWTIMMTDTNGISCLMAAGEAWEKVERKERDRGPGT